MSTSRNAGNRARDLGAPAWDLSPEYDSFDDERLLADSVRLDELLCELESLEPDLLPSIERAESLDPRAEGPLLAAARKAFILGEEADRLLSNLSAFASARLSVDGTDLRAKEATGVYGSLSARLDSATSAASLLAGRASDAFAEALLGCEALKAQRFRVSQLRKYRARLLPLTEEKLLASLAPNGKTAWGDLYDAICGTATCDYAGPDGERRIGLSEAASLWRDGDRRVREAAYKAQSATFALHEESLAAILNAVAGWRLTECARRSRTETVGFIDAALKQNRMEKRSLDAMLSVVDESRELGRKALRLQARLMGVPRLAAYDILAPAPQLPSLPAREPMSFADGLEIVRSAYASIDPSMGDFVLEMRDKKRIEARVLASKRPGAYCTRFAKSRSPRVFLTYRGSLSDVFTLAHELGHAYHGKLLAELPLPETHYPMNLAETASTFAETALGDYLSSPVASRFSSGAAPVGDETLLELAWSDAQDAATFLLNIPARFAFEKRLYELRAEKPLAPAALSDLMRGAWEEYYGDSLSGYDSGFWRSKLHYYMTDISFYNFPYTFGYLFSLGIYARREKLGASFHPAYAALLRDAGRMETEELAKKHLGVDLGKPDFWRESVAIVSKKVERFEALAEKYSR